LEAVTKSSKAVRDVKITLGVGIVILAVIAAVTLTHAPPRVARVGAAAPARLAATIGDTEGCQANELLPSGVSAIRLAFVAYYGARVRVTVSSGSRILTEGRRGPEWTGTSVTVPVTPLTNQASHVQLCFAIGPNSEPIFLLGSPTPLREAAALSPGGPLPGKVGVEYLTAGDGSWWSRILPVARHIAIGHDLSGTWMAWIVVALVAVIGLLALRLVLRESL
jgi:hypothetical protein